MKTFIAAGLIALSASALAAAPEPKQARIPFANQGSIRDWQPDGNRAIYLRADGKQWYHAELFGFCQGLDTALAVGFQTGGIGDFDKFSAIVVRGQRCPVKTLIKSGPPPKKADKAKAKERS
jgi:hypothetical protein